MDPVDSDLVHVSSVCSLGVWIEDLKLIRPLPKRRSDASNDGQVLACYASLIVRTRVQ